MSIVRTNTGRRVVAPVVRIHPPSTTSTVSPPLQPTVLFPVLTLTPVFGTTIGYISTSAQAPGLNAVGLAKERKKRERVEKLGKRAALERSAKKAKE